MWRAACGVRHAGCKAMKENIYNIFLHYAHGVCSTIGYVIHDIDLNDEQAATFLKDKLEGDLLISTKFQLARPFTLEEFNARARLGQGAGLLEEFFAVVDAGPAPFFMMTPVRDGRPFFNYTASHKPLDMADVASKLGQKGVMVDWLVKYTTADGIDITQLIHDDYFLAIKLAYNAGLHVSAMKLLLSCIDSIAYIEYCNDRQTPFIDWLNSYARLAPLGISAPELWELRNGLLHMSNTNSKKVLASRVRRISFFVGRPSGHLPQGVDDTYYFDFYSLIQEFAAAQARWIESYNADREKFLKFVERYDETISDSRVAVICN